MKQFFLFLIIFLSLTGCGDDPVPGNSISVRIIMESEETSYADVRVFVEGDDGNILTGALVMAIDSRNRIETLEFDPDEYCYAGTVQVIGDAVFTIRIKSESINGAIEYTVPHTVLYTEPVLTLFQDSGGNSVLSGQPLSSGNEILAAWDSLGADIVYQVTVKTPFQAVYSASTNAGSLIMPASSIPAGGNYMLEIMAQKIYGDPYFESANYYSVSVIKSAAVLFSVQ